MDIIESYKDKFISNGIGYAIGSDDSPSGPKGGKLGHVHTHMMMFWY